MNIRFFRYYLLLFILVSTQMCSLNQNRKEPADRISITNDTANFNQQKVASNNLGKSFDNRKPFQIVSFEKQISSESTDTDTAKCSVWQLSEQQLQQIILHSKPISGTEWDLSYDVLCCTIEGQLIQNGEKFNFSLNAGSWLRIHCRDTSVLLGNEDKSDEKYFLSSPYKE